MTNLIHDKSVKNIPEVHVPGPTRIAVRGYGSWSFLEFLGLLGSFLYVTCVSETSDLGAKYNTETSWLQADAT